MNVFDIIGSVMVGPSSSHTAGAARIGRVARMILGEEPQEARIQLHGSFSKTMRGHGTDKALAGGLMGFDVDDMRLKDSLTLAEEQNFIISFETMDLGEVHPNTVCINVKGKSGKSVSITGSSVGGGNIVITQIGGIAVEFGGQYYTLIVKHADTPGVIASVTNTLASAHVNIAFMKVYRTVKGGTAIMIIEADQPIQEDIAELIKHIPKVSNATIIVPDMGG